MESIFTAQSKQTVYIKLTQNIKRWAQQSLRRGFVEYIYDQWSHWWRDQNQMYEKLYCSLRWAW